MRISNDLRPGTIAAAAVALLLIGAPVRATLIEGEGNPKSNCYAEFDVDGGTISGNNHNKVTCTDGDPSCDTDGACDGACTFKVRLCVNQTNIPACMPAPLKKTPHSLNIQGPKTTGSEAACGDFASVIVKKVSAKKKTARRTLKVVANATSGKPKNDTDHLFLICERRTGACPSQTTSTSSTTTTTIPAPPTSSLSFTTAVGTTSCGGAGLAPAAVAPFSGEIDSDVAGTTKITDLGLGCLYFGGGAATVVPPGRIPDAAPSFLAITAPGTLGASAGTNLNNCTQGVLATKHCINNNAQPACNTDPDCGGQAGSCGGDAKCAFGPPLPILSPAPFGALTTCVLNVVQSDASGTFDATTGASSVSLPLVSRVYITGNTGSPCPKCAPTCTYGKSPGAACTPVGSLMTSNDCLPSLGGFQAPLGVDLTPLTTGAAEKTDPAGSFCPSQTTAGAFGQATAQRIAETGSPAGNLSDMAAHPSVLASVFCIPATGNPAVDGVSDLPGPGAIGLNGVSQLH
jgi:hypothetical protein